LTKTACIVFFFFFFFFFVVARRRRAVQPPNAWAGEHEARGFCFGASSVSWTDLRGDTPDACGFGGTSHRLYSLIDVGEASRFSLWMALAKGGTDSAGVIALDGRRDVQAKTMDEGVSTGQMQAWKPRLAGIGGRS